MLIEVFLKTAAAPAIAVAILVLLFGHAPEPWRARIQSIIIAAGFFAASYFLAGLPAWPPPSGAGALVYVAIWFALFSWIAPPGSSVRFLLKGIWIIFGAMIAVWSMRLAILNSAESSRNLIAMALLGWAMWFSLDRSTTHSHVLTSIMMGVVALTGASFLFLFKSSLLMSQMLTTMAVVAGGLSVVGWLFPARLSLHATFPFLSGFLAVALIAGMFYLDIDPWLLAAIGIPFLVLIGKDTLRIKASSALSDAILATVLAAVPLGYVLFNVFKSSGPLY